MEMQGEQLIAADKQKVWDALNDPDTLKACITGCQSLEKTGENQLVATVKAAVGPVKAIFKGEVTLEDLNPPESYRLVGQGKGGAAGFAKGHADVNLESKDGGTLLQYAVKANVGGQLARIGSRLVDGAAKKYADEFFSAFKTELERPETPLDAPESQSEGITAQIASEGQAAVTPSQTSGDSVKVSSEPDLDANSGIPPFVWAAGLSIAVILAIIFLTT